MRTDIPRHFQASLESLSVSQEGFFRSAAPELKQQALKNR